MTDRTKMNDTVRTRPLSDGVGVELTDIQIGEGIDCTTVDAIVNLLYRHALV